MEKEVIYTLISCSIYLIGIIPYLRDCIKWKTIPHIYSQFVWTIIMFVSTSVLIAWEEYLAAIPAIIATFFNGVWFFFGIKWKQHIPITLFDKICTALAIFLIIYSIITKDFFHTVLIAIVIDFLAFLPTLKKWWILPWSDTIITWLLSSIQYFFLILTVIDQSFQNIGFWMYNIFITFAFFFIVFLRRWYLKGWKSIFE